MVAPKGAPDFWPENAKKRPRAGYDCHSEAGFLWFYSILGRFWPKSKKSEMARQILWLIKQRQIFAFWIDFQITVGDCLVFADNKSPWTIRRNNFNRGKRVLERHGILIVSIIIFRRRQGFLSCASPPGCALFRTRIALEQSAPTLGIGLFILSVPCSRHPCFAQ